jgi:hypothetical protein
MNRIEVVLSLPVVAPLLDVIKGLGSDLRAAPALGQPEPSGDAEMQETWNADLLDSQRQDLDALLSLFGQEFFAEGKIHLDRDNAEPVVRSCSAIRLLLRQRRLGGLPDEALESGEVEPEKLEEGVRRPFLCYLFLATLQELIIRHLDDGTFDTV